MRTLEATEIQMVNGGYNVAEKPATFIVNCAEIGGIIGVIAGLVSKNAVSSSGFYGMVAGAGLALIHVAAGAIDLLITSSFKK